MARIRSVHPSLFTDEGWVSCSPLARLLAIGLWTDADDQGVFEWKPLQIKMRLLPGDNADVATLLTELVGANIVRRYTVGRKDYGAIRNFRVFQRPKKPNAIHPVPKELRIYVGLDEPDAEPDHDEGASVPNQFPTGGEIPPQMEDGGCRREESTPNDSPRTPRDADDRSNDDWKGDLFARYQCALNAAGMRPVAPTSINAQLAQYELWERDGFELEADIIPVIQAKMAGLPEDEHVSTLKFFDKALRASKARRAARDARPDLTPAAPPPRLAPLVFARPDEPEEIAAFRAALADATPLQYRAWFDTAAIAVTDDRVVITMPSAFAADQAPRDAGTDVERLARSKLGARFVTYGHVP